LSWEWKCDFRGKNNLRTLSLAGSIASHLVWV
jgi:hypothetical protein